MQEKPQRLGPKLLEKLRAIMKQEKERGREKTSYAEAGEILSIRIDKAGGLKWVTACYYLLTIVYK